VTTCSARPKRWRVSVVRVCDEWGLPSDGSAQASGKSERSYQQSYASKCVLVLNSEHCPGFLYDESGEALSEMT
jgi:hypothetical protein